MQTVSKTVVFQFDVAIARRCPSHHLTNTCFKLTASFPHICGLRTSASVPASVSSATLVGIQKVPFSHFQPVAAIQYTFRVLRMEDLPMELWLRIASYTPKNHIYKLLGINRPLFHAVMDYLYRELEYPLGNMRVLQINDQLR